MLTSVNINVEAKRIALCYRPFLFCWAILFCLQAFSQSPVNRIEDSLQQLLSSATTEKEKMELYNKLRRATYYSNPSVSENYTKQYLTYAEIVGDSLQIAIANFYLGNANVVNGNPDIALPYYLKAAAYFESKEDELSRLSSTYNGIASAYENNLSDSLSLVYFEKSYQVSKQAKDQRRMGIALINRSNIHSRIGEVDTAIQLLTEAVDRLQDPSSQVYLMPARINLAAAYVENNNLEAAKPLYESLLQEIDSVEDVLNYSKTLANYGLFFQKKGEVNKAQKYLQLAYQKFTVNGFMKERFNMMPDLIKAYQKTNQLPQAIGLFYEYSTIKDSIFSAEKDQRLTEALQKYEAQKKDKELLEKQLEIEKKSQENSLLLYVSVAILSFFVVLIVFLKKRIQYQKTISLQQENLQKQQIKELTQQSKMVAMNSLIEGQEAERLRIAKDLHDSLGGLLSNVKAHFTALKKEKLHTLDSSLATRTHQLIDEACLEVRRISHNMMPHALGIAGLEGALQDIADDLRKMNIQVELHIHVLPVDIEQTKQITLYRIVQEIVSNIIKHAETDKMYIQLNRYQNQILLTIEDEGKGFDYDKGIRKGGLGIKSIHSRVEFLDGKIEWDSKPSYGTTITIRIPL